MRENRIVGILRLTDVFHEVCREIKNCTVWQIQKVAIMKIRVLIVDDEKEFVDQLSQRLELRE